MWQQLGVLSVTFTLPVLVYSVHGDNVTLQHVLDPTCKDELKTMCPIWAKQGRCCEQYFFDKCQLSCTTCGPGPQACNISGTMYPSGTEFQNNCMSFYCEAGEFYTRNQYNAECGTCLVQNDPHFFSYHDVKFDWHGHETYVLSQKGFANCSDEYVNALFSDCDVGAPWATCLDTIYFQPQPDTNISIIKANDIYKSLVTVNGVINNITKERDGKLHILDGAVDSKFPVFAWFNDKCLHIMSSRDNGFLMKLSSWSLKIFAPPKFSNNLGGLCGNWDKDSTRYSKGSQHVWDAGICADIGLNNKHVSLEKCKDLCDDTTGKLEEPCNAIKYKHNDCILLRCPLPIPYGTVISQDYLGYIKGGIDKLALRNGSVVIPPRNDKYFSNWKNMNIDEMYGHDWKVTCEMERSTRDLVTVDPNPCDLNETRLNEIEQNCENEVEKMLKKTTGLSDVKIAAIKADCSFDQCIAKRAENEVLAMAWLNEVKVLIQREELEIENTVEYTHDPCFVGSNKYSSGTKWEDNCMSFYCEKGMLYTTNKYNSHCSACTSKNDPHFETFDGVKYDWHGRSTYILSQEGNADCPDTFVSSKFQPCAFGLPGATCLHTIYMQFTENIFIEVKVEKNMMAAEIIVDGISKNIAYKIENEIHLLNENDFEDEKSAVFGWMKDKCLHIMGFKKRGYLVKICNWSVKVFAHPSKANKLYGLCGNLNGDTSHDLRLRNDESIKPPGRCFFCFANMNVDPTFGKHWEIRDCAVFTNITTTPTVISVVKLCDADNATLDGYLKTCEAKLNFGNHIFTTAKENILADCAFDQCISASNQTIAMEWLIEVQNIITIQEEEIKNTVDVPVMCDLPCLNGGVCIGKTNKCKCKAGYTGAHCQHKDPNSCFIGGKMYKSGEEWQDNCMMFHCKEGKFYTSQKYNRNCGICQVNNDPHFVTYDGVTYDWHGHSSYILSQRENDTCPEVSISGKFKNCGPKYPFATCVDTVYYQLDKETNIKIVKEGTLRKVSFTTYVNGEMILEEYLDEGEIQPLKRETNEYPVFTWKYDNCLHIMGFESKGFLIKFCSWTLKIYAHPALSATLFGLCGDFNNSRMDDLKKRDGSIVQQPSGIPNKIVDSTFGNNWEVQDCEAEEGVRTPPGSGAKPNEEDPCKVTDDGLLKGYENECQKIVYEGGKGLLSNETKKRIFDNCVFDRCIADNEDFTIVTQWMNEIEILIIQEEKEIDNTETYPLGSGKCPAGFKEIASQCLNINTDLMLNWEEARIHCGNNKGRLAVIQKAEDLKIYLNEKHNGFRFWIGATDVKKEGVWVWLSGMEVPGNPAFPWAPTEPNNFGGNEHCLEYNGNLKGFTDVPCSSKLNFICEENTVPEEIGSCIIDEKSYPNGKKWIEGCITYYCKDGRFYTDTKYHGECGICTVKNDPHFTTFDGTTYDWHGKSTYTITQEGPTECPSMFVHSHFSPCAFGLPGATCLHTIYFQPVKNTLITIIKDNHIEQSQISVDGLHQTINAREGQLQVLKGPNNKLKPAFGWMAGGCLHIIAFDQQGFMIKLCKWSLKVFAHPKVAHMLHGLCGDWNGNKNGDLKKRNGDIITPPGGFWFSKNVNAAFGNDWEVKTTCAENPVVTVPTETFLDTNGCTATSTERDQFLNTCKRNIEDNENDLDDNKITELVDGCAFDLCIANKTGNETITSIWLEAIILNAKEEKEEAANTIKARKPGSCYLDGIEYIQGSEWDENCMSYYCKNGKFYTSNSYNRDCGSCDANNDPHFKTFDGVTYDWHGHSTYVVTQHGSTDCPDVFVNSQFTKCASGMPHATCVHIVFIQPLKGTLIKVVKHTRITDSEVYIDGYSQKIMMTEDKELQILKGPNEKEHPAFAWFFNGCLHIQGFQVSGYLVKICHWSLKVFAHPTSANKLYGLCGDWNRDRTGDLKLRNGVIIKHQTGFWFNKNVDSKFGNDWEVINCPKIPAAMIGGETNTTVIENPCQASEADRDNHHMACTTTLTAAKKGLDDKKLQLLIDDCAFDRCIAAQTGNETLINIWTAAVLGILEEEEQELVNIGLGSGACYIDGKGYPSGQEWQENCMRFYCEEGKFYSRKVYNKECGQCTSQNDPHFTTYDKVKFDWHGQATYVISQQGPKDCPNVFVNSKFKNCAQGLAGATCLDIIYYKNKDCPSVKIVKNEWNVQNSEIDINGHIQKLTTNNDGELQILKGPNNKEYPVFGLIHSGCIHIIGFDNSGFLIKLCKWALTVYAHPSLKFNLYGLCGDWDNSKTDDLKKRGGDPIRWPSHTSGGFLGLFKVVKKNVDNEFGNSWKVKNCPILPIGPTEKDEIIDNTCDAKKHELEDYEKKCQEIVDGKNADLDDETLQAIKDDCIFDRCIAVKSGNKTLQDDWLNEAGGIVDQKKEEKENTIDPGYCFLGGNKYKSGTQWTENCMTYYCEQGKFYSTNKYDDRCGSCSVANDPHFTTYDGVRYDWHGHSTYVISQQSGVDCPDAFVNCQFTDCARGHPKATCLHTIYFQPKKGITIIIEKDNHIQNSKIYVNGHLQKIYVKNNRELQILKGNNNIKQPAFGWINNNCLFFIGFDTSGYMIKLCNWNLKVYAHPSLKRQLYGLCGDWNKNNQDDIRLRTGMQLTAPSGGGFARKQVKAEFGNSWEIKLCLDNGVISTVPVEGTACNATVDVQNKYLETCRRELTPFKIGLDEEKLNGLIDGCAFDQCIAEQTGKEQLKKEWLNECVVMVKEEEEEIKNTVKSGNCYIDGVPLRNGDEWKRGCMTCYCKDGKFYSHNIYNRDCPYCSVKSDPHFRTYDGTTYDWQGHNTYVLSQIGSNDCPKEYVYSHFKWCTPRPWGATCLDEVYFQPLEGLEIKIIKAWQLKDSMVFVNGYKQFVAIKPKGELQVLKESEEKEVPVFAWFFGNCIHMIAFNREGFMIKLCHWYLRVYAHKTLKSNLYGLCGDWDGARSRNLKLRNHKIINAPGGGFWPFVNRNVNPQFGNDWEIKAKCATQGILVDDDGDDDTDACTASDKEKAEYAATCRKEIAGSTNKLKQEVLEPLISDCAFDRCVAIASGDEFLIKKWLSLSKGIVHQIEEEEEHTGGGTCQPGWVMIDQQCFYFAMPNKGDKGVTWEGAFEQCQKKNGRLAVIKDYKSFSDYIKKTYGRNHYYWVGISDIEMEGDFHYITGDRVGDEIPWHRGEPNNHHNNEDCVEVYCQWGTFNDRKCSSNRMYVCDDTKGELTLPEPAALIIRKRIHEKDHEVHRKICRGLFIFRSCRTEPRPKKFILFTAKRRNRIHDKEKFIFIEKSRFVSDTEPLQFCELYRKEVDLGNGHITSIFLLPEQDTRTYVHQLKLLTDIDETLTKAELRRDDVEKTNLIESNVWTKIKC